MKNLTLIFGLLFLTIGILGIVSCLIVFVQKSSGIKDRIYHHLIGTLNIVINSIGLFGNILLIFFYKSSFEISVLLINLVLLIIGVLTNLRTRNKL
jgi:hypothetical protein